MTFLLKNSGATLWHWICKECALCDFHPLNLDSSLQITIFQKLGSLWKCPVSNWRFFLNSCLIPMIFFFDQCVHTTQIRFDVFLWSELIHLHYCHNLQLFDLWFQWKLRGDRLYDVGNSSNVLQRELSRLFTPNIFPGSIWFIKRNSISNFATKKI